MSRFQHLERFPDLVSPAHSSHVVTENHAHDQKMGRPRRKSSGLGADIRGDTGAPAVSTLDPMPVIASPPLTPRPSSSSIRRVSKRSKIRTFLRRWKRLSFTHTWINPLVLMLIILSLYATNPTESNPLHRAIFLSYPLRPDDPLIPQWARDDPDMPTYYGKGLADIAFVSFYIIVLSFTREFLMQRLIRPMAIRCGIHSRSKQSRFMEQVYTAMYFTVAGPLGVYVMSQTPIWYFDTNGMYESFPHRSHDGLFKAYYLLQASYWAQQAIVLLLRLEKPRKDYNELVGHHIVTLALIALSYRFHFTYMGIAVYISHDISDFFLATSKTLNYIDSPITAPYFSVFTVVWIYCRHYLNLKILWSILTNYRTVGPFELNWETQQYKCWLSQYITFFLLTCLQALNLFWLYFVLRIAYNKLFNDHLEDVRSDDESMDDESEVKNKKGMKSVPSTVNGVAKSPALSAAASGVESVPFTNGSPVETQTNAPYMSGSTLGGHDLRHR